MATKVFKCVILGAPGSGKGTISSRIVKNFNLEHVSSGDKLRLNIKNNTGKNHLKRLLITSVFSLINFRTWYSSKEIHQSR